MPHIHITYSANLEDVIDITDLCNTLRLACIEFGVAPVAGVRVRAVKCDHYSIADGDAKHGYIDFSVRLREGRTDEIKQNLTNVLFAAAQSYLADQFKTHSIALSMETRDIDASLSPKFGSIRDFLSGPSSSQG